MASDYGYQRGGYVPRGGRGRGSGGYAPRGRGSSEYAPRSGYAPRGRGRGSYQQVSAPTVATDKSYLLQHLDGFFGTRNGITLDPKEGVNFTLETLTYMTSRSLADRITNMIVDCMGPTRSPFRVVECCAGIGGNTLSFLDNPNIGLVASYEINPTRRAMLRNNINAYKLQDKSYVPDADTGFPGINPDDTGVVLYMDPPWLPSDIKGHESTKEQYILSGIRVGPYTLEQWIATCPNCAMVVIRVPPGYQLAPVPGFLYENIPVSKSLLIIATSEVGMRLAIHPPVPVVIQEPPIAVSIDESKWETDLRNFIYTTLAKFIPDEKVRTELVSEKAMPYWITAFTHESYDPLNNFEDLETLGDKMLKSVFIRYDETN